MHSDCLNRILDVLSEVRKKLSFVRVTVLAGMFFSGFFVFFENPREFSGAEEVKISMIFTAQLSLFFFYVLASADGAIRIDKDFGTGT